MQLVLFCSTSLFQKEFMLKSLDFTFTALNVYVG